MTALRSVDGAVQNNSFCWAGMGYGNLPPPRRKNRARDIAPGDSSEDDGLVAVLNDAVLAVPPHGTGQSGAFDVCAESRQVPNGMAVIHPDDVLLDDRPVVEPFGHVVSGRADELDIWLLGTSIRPTLLASAAGFARLPRLARGSAGCAAGAALAALAGLTAGSGRPTVAAGPTVAADASVAAGPAFAAGSASTARASIAVAVVTARVEGCGAITARMDDG
jgi:hypothetical protein